jgi:hypothetical protein
LVATAREGFAAGCCPLPFDSSFDWRAGSCCADALAQDRRGERQHSGHQELTSFVRH